MATNPKIQVDIVAEDKATEDLEAVQKQMAAIEGETTTVKIDATKATGGIDKLGKSAGSSKSVLANMVGNTTQDLGALGGIAGSTGVAFGQMGEYMADAAAEGEGLGSVLGNFAKVAGPIAAISVGISLVTSAIQEHKQRQAEMAAAVKATTEAFEDGIGAIDGWKKALEESIVDGSATAAEAFSKFMVDALDKTGHLADVQESLGVLGLHLSDLGPVLTSADQDFQSWGRTLLKNKGLSDDAAAAIAKIVDNTGSMRDIEKSLVSEGITLNDELFETVRAMNEVDDAVGDLDLEKSSRQFLNSQAAIDEDTDARVRNAREGVGSQIDALNEYIDAVLAANEAAETTRVVAAVMKGVTGAIPTTTNNVFVPQHSPAVIHDSGEHWIKLNTMRTGP